MFVEFRSNLLLLLQSRFPEGMQLKQLEEHYSNYFHQSVEPFMFYIGALSWLDVITETPLRNDTIVWERDSEVFIKCVVARSDWEMKLIAKLAKYSHFQYAQSSYFKLQECSCCCDATPPLSNVNKNGERNELSSSRSDHHHHHQSSKEVDVEEYVEHLDRGCFMGVLSPAGDDDTMKREIMESRYFGDCDHRNSEDSSEIKREVTSPISADNNYVSDYLLSTPDMILQSEFVDIGSVKVENEAFDSLDGSTNLYEKEDSQDETSDKSLNCTEEPPMSASKTVEESVKETENKSIVDTVTVVSTKRKRINDNDPNYEPESEEESEDVDGDSDETDRDNNATPTLTAKTKTIVLVNSAGTKRHFHCEPARFKCQWNSCSAVYDRLSNLTRHTREHLVNYKGENSTSHTALSVALCQSGITVAGADQVTTIQAQDERLHDNTSETLAKSKMNSKKSKSAEVQMFNCSTLGCNRSFVNLAKLNVHQRRCCAIVDFSCRWPECTMVFQSSLDLHNHVKLDHRKSDYLRQTSGLIEKNIIFNCSRGACGYYFSSREKLVEHEKDCVFNVAVNVKSSTSSTTTTLETARNWKTKLKPSLSNGRQKVTTSESEPRGFARISKYTDK